MRPPLEPGARFADYRIAAILGRGGMSTVYRAEEQRPRRMVALKVLDEQLAADETFRQRFEREADLASALEHPNIIPVYDFGEDDGRLWLATRLVESADLRQLLSSAGALPLDRVLSIVIQVARALDHAHRSRGLIHRDVKPANVLVVPAEDEGEEDHVYLADFGLAKRSAGSVHLTRSQFFLGTVGYASPEQIRGEMVDARADIYALGCLLYECLTGKVPFDADSEEGMLYAHLERERPAPSRVRPDLPPRLDGVVAKAMAIDREQRYQTVRDFVVDLRKAAGVATGERPVVTSAPAPAAPPPRAQQETMAPSAPLPLPPPPEPSPPPPARFATVTELELNQRRAGDGVPPTSPPARPAGVPGGSRRTPLLAGATIALLVVAGVVVALVASGGGGGEAKDAKRASSTRTTPKKPRPARPPAVLATLHLGGADAPPAPAGGGKPFGVTVAAGSVWVANGRRSVVQRVDPKTNRLLETIRVGQGPTEPVVAGGALWTPNAVGDSVSRVSLRRPHRVTTIPVGDKPDDTAFGAGLVWVPLRYDEAVVRIDPRTGRVRGPRIPVGRQPGDVLFAAGALWVTNTLDGTLSRIEPASGRVTKTVKVATAPEDIAYGFGRLWLPDLARGVVVRVDPKTMKVVGHPIRTGRETSDTTVANGFVWAVNHGGNTVVRIDPRRARVVGRPLRVGDRPIDIVPGAGALWVTDFASATLTKLRP